MQQFDGLGAIRSMDYVILLCDDLSKMKKFYDRVFKFQIEDEEPGLWVGYRVGTLFIGLRPRGRAYDGPRVPAESASVQLSFRVPPADVDIAYELLLSKGVEVIEKPTNQHWPHRTLFFQDPEGNIIEIYADIHPKEMAESPTGNHGLIHANVSR